MEQIAIVSFKNSHSTQSRSGMSRVMNYCKRADKTAWQGHQLVSGVNCHPQSVYDDFLRTKLSYHKDKGRLYYHMVQSFPKGADVDPEVAHAAALRLAEWYKGREVLVCTHTDREHIHSHFIINSVSFVDGKKLHLGSKELESIQRSNDRVCMEFGLPVFEGQHKQGTSSIAYGEYHAAAKGESWKFQLMNTIDLCMRRAKTRKEFIREMEHRGYQVRWEKNRKAITYTTPTGMKCRDDRLHDKKYLKEVMEHEFRIREEIIRRRVEAEEYASRDDPHRDRASVGLSHPGAVGGDDGLSGRAVSGGSQTAQPVAETERHDESDALHHADGIGTDEKVGEVSDGDDLSNPTGWEEARAAAFSPQDTSAPGHAHVVVDYPDPGRLVGAVAALGRTLERGQDAPPMRDATAIQGHSDRKALSKERQKKINQGHKPDDRESPAHSQQMM